MPTIKVAKAFTLTLEPKPLGESTDVAGKPVTVYQGEPDKLRFTPGEHEVEQAIADHWYVKTHLEGAVEHHPQRLLYQQAAEQAGQQARGTSQPIVQHSIPGEGASEVMSRSGEVPEGAHYFAGAPQVDRPMPGEGGPGEPGIGYLPPAPPKARAQHKRGE